MKKKWDKERKDGERWTFSFFLGSKHREMLRKEADRIGASQAFVLRQAIEKFFEKVRK